MRTVWAMLLLAASAAAQITGWATPAEKADFRKTPDYEETMAYIRRIAAAAPRQVKLEAFGKTGEGRTLWTVIVSRDGVFDPAVLHRAKRPIVLVQNGIHAGEIEGKDATLALLREMLITKSQAKLLERAVLVFIPVYNVDGHERISRYNRINQNGPDEMGWRTNASNLNLNRDYMKADAPETRAFLKLWNRWLPDFFMDNHVTDGSDHQYVVLYTLDTGPDVDPGIAQWAEGSLFPYIEKSVTAQGHAISLYRELADQNDPSKGLTLGQSPPRFANGYTTVQSRPGMLVEMHMLKDYRMRVNGNYEIMRATFELLTRDADKLIALNQAADAATIAAGKSGGEVALRVAATGETEPFDFLGYKFKIVKSDVSGADWIQYTTEPATFNIPRQNKLKVTRAVKLPAAYVVPAQWTHVIDVLAAHGVQMQRIAQPLTTTVEVYRCRQPKWQTAPFEGRHTASFTGTPMGDAGFLPEIPSEPACTASTQTMSYPAGSVIVPTAQRAAKVVAHFLEPEAPDSAVSWGFFDAIFEQKEYGESYVMEKVAREMIAKDPQLKEEFEKKVATDKAFAADPAARLNWFYARSPWWDHRIGLYPVGRLSKLP